MLIRFKPRIVQSTPCLKKRPTCELL